MTNENLAKRRALLGTADQENREARITALVETMLDAVHGDEFHARLAVRDLADIGIEVKGACRAAA